KGSTGLVVKRINKHVSW
ncbi:hypothetical protein D030_3596B, partial [Vibrio parahaemolyticus AQ3810]